MQKQQKQIYELLERHSHLSPLQRCAFHWISPNETLDWYLGFLQCLEICEGIRQLFAEEKQSEAYQVLAKRLPEELAKFAENQDDWTQRLKETPYDPLEDIRQEHETWLAELEGLAVQAIASGSWTPVLEHLNEIMAWQDGKLHQAQKSKASADSLDGSSAGPDQTTDVNES